MRVRTKPLVPLLLVVTLGIGWPAAGGECVVIDRNTKKMVTDDPCKPVAFEAEVCFEGRGGTPTCVWASQTNPFVPGKEGSGKTLKRLVSLLRGDPVSAYGGKRLKDLREIPGFPYGKIALPPGDLTIRLGAAGPGGVRSLTVFAQADMRRPLFSASPAGDVVRVPAQALRAGGSYVWVAETAEGAVRGSFRVIDASQQTELERELEAARGQAGRSELARRLAEAAVYDDFGYVFDRDAVLAQARAGLGPKP